MTIIDGWFDWAVRDPGPDDRAAFYGPVPSDMDTMTHHSMEGWFDPISASNGGYNAMRDPSRFATAWHGSVCIRPIMFKGEQYPIGTLFQHYPVQQRLVHGNAANPRGPGFELEGGAGDANEPIPYAAILTYQRMHRDLRAFTGKPFLREPGTGRGLVEHREMGPTACPSGRYDPLWAALGTETEDGVTRDEYAALELRVTALELALMSGSEERLPLAERQTNAQYRIQEVAKGNAQSVAQRAAQVAKHGHKACVTTVTVGDPVI